MKRKMLSTKKSTSRAAEVAEVLGDREAGEGHAGAGAGRLVHLPEHERDVWLSLSLVHVDLAEVPAAFLHGVHEVLAVLDDAGLEHLAHEVVALTRPLADAGEHREAVVRLGDVVDELHG